MKIEVIGMDPSLCNWGLAKGSYDTRSQQIEISQIDLINPVLPKGKQIRQNSVDLEAACQLYIGAQNWCKGAQAVFVEVPIGSQSARAMASYGICVGILGALRSEGTPHYELTPTEVKLAGFGKKTATKREMIAWAMETHPEANWPRYKQHGIPLVSEGKAEHMADAIGAIHAGIKSNAFQQLITLLERTHNANLFATS